MSYPPDTSRSCHEADGRSDRSGGSGGGATGSGSSVGGVYGNFPFVPLPRSGAKSNNLTESAILSNPNPSRLSQNWRKWSLGLDYLLQDSDGVALFKSYLHDEGCANLLDFWFACQGFRSKVDPSDHRKIAQLIKAIYRTYIRGSGCSNSVQLSSVLSEQAPPAPSRTDPIRLRAETRRLIAERISHRNTLDQTVFNPAQVEVEQFLRTTAYPAFLKSDCYVAFLQTALQFPSMRLQSDIMSTSWTIDSSGTNPLPQPPSLGNVNESMSMYPLAGGQMLPTLEEDKELKSDEIAVSAATAGCFHPIGTGSSMVHSTNYPQTHCTHCLYYHSQGHVPPVPPSTVGHQLPIVPPHQCMVSPKYGTPWYPSAAPLTVENIQMTQFYRADLSLQQDAAHVPSPSTIRPPSHDPANVLPQPHLTTKRNVCHQARDPRLHTNYPYTHWTDDVCPQMMTPTIITNPRLSGNVLPSQPPNPYHISYAPVSARDSERHSQSSGARTDDTHSHTDSSHDGAGTRLWKSGFNPRYPDSDLRYTRPPLAHHRHQTSVGAPHHAPFERSARFIGYSTGPPHSPPSHILSPKAAPVDNYPLHIQSTLSAHQRTPPSAPEPSKSRHQRRSARRGLPPSNGRGGKSLDTPTDHQPISKSGFRPHTLAEKDPPAFFRILSEKLQRVYDDQLVTERLDKLMTETSPNPSDDPKDPTDHPESHDARHIAPALTTASSCERAGEPSEPAMSFLKRPWADRLLAAARVQHENTEDNAQAILEDHCSRIWAASADRTPSSTGSGGSAEAPRRSEPPPLTDSPPPSVVPQTVTAPCSTADPLHTVGLDSWDVADVHAILDCAPCIGKGSRGSPPPIPNLTSSDVHHSVDHRQDNTAAAPLMCASNQPPSSSSSSGPPPPTQSSNPSTTLNSASSPIYTTTTATTTTSIVSHCTPSGPLVSSTGSSGGGAGGPQSLVIGYYLCDDPVPYRSVWPSSEITLGQFKQLIPKKKGSFRYFFKKFSDEFDSAGVVHQEITNDHCLLPLWEGKVVAKVERID